MFAHKPAYDCEYDYPPHTHTHRQKLTVINMVIFFGLFSVSSSTKKVCPELVLRYEVKYRCGAASGGIETLILPLIIRIICLGFKHIFNLKWCHTWMPLEIRFNCVLTDMEYYGILCSIPALKTFSRCEIWNLFPLYTIKKNTFFCCNSLNQDSSNIPEHVSIISSSLNWGKNITFSFMCCSHKNNHCALWHYPLKNVSTTTKKSHLNCPVILECMPSDQK